MSNDSSPVGGGHGFDSDALEQWVAETARQKGVSKQRLLDEILSSYWVLEELSEVVSDSAVSDESTPAESRQPDGSPHPDESRRPAERADPADEPQPTERSADAGAASSGVEFSDLKAELQEIRSAVDELSTPESDSSEADAPDETQSTEVSFLEDQLEDFSSAVVDQQTETEASVEKLSARVTEIDERLEAIESELATGMSVAELREAVGETKTAHDDLEGRIESEFDSIEQVLQHLLDTTDNIEYRLGTVSDSRDEALRPIQQRHAMQDELAELKQEAIRHGVKTCNCDSCGQSIDLGLLERPECPSCERRATGISKSGWLSFSKPELKTTHRERPPADRSADAGESWRSTDHQQTARTQSQTDW